MLQMTALANLLGSKCGILQEAQKAQLYVVRDLVALFNRVDLVGPIRAEVVWKIEYLHIGKAHLTRFCVCWFEFRATVQRTTSTIEHNESLARECVHMIQQLLDTR
jgi:hypothetical protein